MSMQNPSSPYYHPRVLVIDTNEKSERIDLLLKALASDKRLSILRILSNRICSVNDIADSLDMPTSTATMHINILQAAGLVTTELKPAHRGLQKVCSRVYDMIEVKLPVPLVDDRTIIIDITMPIGAYVDCQVAPTCGLVGEVGIIGELDDPTTFYHPDRIYTQLLWFRHGYVEYRFPNRLPTHLALESLQISMEVCSEAPHANPDWRSEITMWVNGVEIGAWISPGDFGGQRGALTPLWWDEWNTQYGLLKMWRITPEGSFIDGVKVSSVNIEMLNMPAQHYITVRLGVKNERTPGGMNLFGSKFGNYPQDIVMRMRCQPK